MKKIIAILILAIIVGMFAVAAMAAPIGNPIITQNNTVAAGSLTPSNTYKLLNGLSVTTGATGGYVMVFDSTSVPADGTVTPKNCYQLSASNTIGVSWADSPEPFTNGIVLVFSSGANCFTKTISNTAFFNAQVQ